MIKASLTSTVVLCTKNRTEEVGRFLESLSAQKRKPDQVLVIDGASNPAVERIARKFDGSFAEVKYSTIKGDLTSARNLGVSLASGDILFFLDDDLVLDDEFVSQIMEAFEGDASSRIGGVCGTIANHSRQRGLRLLFNRLFFLPGDGNGKFRASGAATWVYGLSDARFVEFLPGGLTAYRKEVFSGQRFDEALPLFGFTDDVDFSFRVSRRYKNFYNPRAKAHHLRPVSDRAMKLSIMMTWIWAYWRTYRRNHRKLKGYPALCLLTFGFFLKFVETNVKTYLRHFFSHRPDLMKEAS